MPNTMIFRPTVRKRSHQVSARFRAGSVRAMAWHRPYRDRRQSPTLVSICSEPAIAPAHIRTSVMRPGR